MKGFLLLAAIFIGSNSFAKTDLRKEIKDLINSNLNFYTKIELGMGVAGEMLSDQVDESGQYQNCTIAMRGKSFLINTTLDKDYNFHYQEHWIDINIKEGNQCDPEMYPKERSRFVTMEKKRNSVLELFKILDEQEELNIEKITDKIFVLKFTLIDQGEEFPINAKYDLSFPLFMNPDNNGFKNQYFSYTALDLSNLPLCRPIDDGGDCSENQDLTYLLNL